jgi:hypothetical protein
LTKKNDLSSIVGDWIMIIGEIGGTPAWVIHLKFWQENNVMKGLQKFGTPLATHFFHSFVQHENDEITFLRTDGTQYKFKIMENGYLAGKFGTSYNGRFYAVRGLSE